MRPQQEHALRAERHISALRDLIVLVRTLVWCATSATAAHLRCGAWYPPLLSGGAVAVEEKVDMFEDSHRRGVRE